MRISSKRPQRGGYHPVKGKGHYKDKEDDPRDPDRADNAILQSFSAHDVCKVQSLKFKVQGSPNLLFVICYRLLVIANDEYPIPNPQYPIQ